MAHRHAGFTVLCVHERRLGWNDRGFSQGTTTDPSLDARFLMSALFEYHVDSGSHSFTDMDQMDCCGDRFLHSGLRLKWSRRLAIRSLSLISCGCDRSLRNLLTKAAIERGKCRDRHFGMSAGPRALSSALKQSSQGLASAFRVVGRFNVDWNDLRWPVMTKGSVMTESPVCRRLL